MAIGGKVGLVRNQGLQMSSSSSIDVVLVRFTSLSNTEEGGLLVVLDFFYQLLNYSEFEQSVVYWEAVEWGSKKCFWWKLFNFVLFFGLGAYRKITSNFSAMSIRDKQRLEADMVQGVEGTTNQQLIHGQFLLKFVAQLIAEVKQESVLGSLIWTKVLQYSTQDIITNICVESMKLLKLKFKKYMESAGGLKEDVQFVKNMG